MPAAPAPMTTTSKAALWSTRSASAALLLARAGVRRALADDLREPRRVAARKLRVGEGEEELAVQPSAVDERQRLERPRGELLADRVLDDPGVPQAHRNRTDRGRLVAHGP